MKKLTIILILFSTFLFSQQSIFWKISKDDSESYILGTYHYLGKDFINENKHLPNVPSATDIRISEISLGDMNATLLRKIEELTLYIIEQDKRIEKLENKKE